MESLVRSSLVDGTWRAWTDDTLEVWVKVCNEREKQEQKAKKYWKNKKQHTFLHYCLHDIPNPFTQYSSPFASWCQPTFQVSSPSSLPCIFCPSIMLCAFSHRLSHTLSFVSAPECVSTSALQSHTQFLTLSMPFSFSENFANSPLLQPHSPHPTSRNNCLPLELLWFFQYLDHYVDIGWGQRTWLTHLGAPRTQSAPGTVLVLCFALVCPGCFLVPSSSTAPIFPSYF